MSFIRRKPFVLFFLLASALFTPALLKAQSNFDNGMENFSKNQLDKAREYFTKATAEGKDKAESFLMLGIMASIDKSDEEAFSYFKQFYASSDNPEPYLEALFLSDVCFNEGSKKTKEQLAFIELLLKDPKISGTLRDNLYSILGEHYQISQQDKKAKQAFSKLQTLRDWQVVGVFENISASGFDKEYEPISNPKSASGFKNKYGAMVNWMKLPPNRNDQWIDFSYLYGIRNTICFAQTFIKSPDDRELQLRIGVSGSLKAWVNDNLVFSETEERNNGEDSYTIKVRLKKGYNRILLQIGTSEDDRSNFMVRLTDEKGNSVSDLTGVAEPQEYAKDAGYKATVYPIPVEEYFKKKISEQPTKLLNYIVLGTAYLQESKSYEARKVLLQAKAMAPNCSYLYYKLIEAYNRENDRTDVEIALAWLKDNDPDNPVALSLMYNEEFEKENYKEAEKILDKIEKLFGERSGTLKKRVELAAKNGKQDEIVKLVEQGYKKYPDVYFFVNLKQLVEISVNKNTDAAISVVKKYLKENYYTEAYKELAAYYFKKGKNAEAIEVYKTLIEKRPGNDNYPYKLAEIYFNSQQYDLAVTYYKNTIALAPYESTYWEGLAKCYDNQNKTQDAIDAYNKAIAYSPTSYTSRKALRKLQSKKEVFDYFEQPDIYAIYKKSADASEYPEDNSLILLNDAQRVIYAGGASEEKHTIVVKVFNTEGIDAWKEYSIGGHSTQRFLIEKAEVLKKNGSRVAAETNGSKVVFTSLEPGDAISLIYRLTEYQSGKLAANFSDYHYFSKSYPYIKTRYSLLISPDIKFSYRFTKDTITPVISTKDEFKLYVWSKENQPSIKSESRMPKIVDVGQVLFLSSFPDWTYVSNWYNDLSATKAKADFEVQEVVADLMKGKENYTDLQKVKEIYDYIVKNIRYSSVSFLQSGLIPKKASAVINTKIGDCKDVATLFVAMCKEINVPAGLVLVNTRENGRKDIFMPSIDFNHCIAKCTVNKKDYYIELTSDYLPFSSFYSSLLNAFTLDVKSDKEKQTVNPVFLNPPTRKQNVVQYVSNITPVGDDVVITRTSYSTGQYAARLRSTYRDLGKKEREKEILKKVSEEYSKVKLDSITFTGLSDRRDTVTSHYVLTGSDAMTHVGNLYLFVLPWMDKATAKDFVFENNRQYPIDVNGFYALENDRETIALKIPGGHTLSVIPKNIKYSCSIADFEITYKVLKDRIIATRELTFKDPLVPLDKIEEFREFYKKVITADAKQIAFN